VNIKSIAGWMGVAFIGWWMTTNPHGDEHILFNIGTFLSTAAHTVSSFFTSI
jgi:hypothetical protein